MGLDAQDTPGTFSLGAQSSGTDTRGRFATFGLYVSDPTDGPLPYGVLGGIADATVYVRDQETPTVTSVSGASDAWVAGGTSVPLVVHAEDGAAGNRGLGIQSIALHAPGKDPVARTYACSGVRADDRCPQATSSDAAGFSGDSFTIDTSALAQGTNTIDATATDLLGKVSPAAHASIKVDGVAPTASASGDLVDDAGHAVYQQDSLSVHLSAHDNDSGVASLRLEDVDDGVVDGTQATVDACTSSQCPTSAGEDVTLSTAALSVGTHHLRVAATDMAGNTGYSAPWSVTIKAAPTCTKTFLHSTGAWSSATNWSDGTVPSATDVVCISPGSVVTAYSTMQAAVVWAPDASVDLAGGVLTVSDTDNDSRIKSLTIDGGVLSGPATVMVSGALDWSNGGMQGTGTTVVGPSASASLHPPNGQTIGMSQRTLRNEGSLTWSSGSLQADYATIDNRGTFRANSQDMTGNNGAGLYSYNGPSQFLNVGTLSKSAGTGQSRIVVPIDNTGAVSTQTGELMFQRGTVTGDAASGSWSADPGAKTTWSYGTFALGSAVRLSGDVAVEATASALSVQGPAANLIVDDGGTISLTDTTTDSHVGDLTLVNGSLGGAATVRVSDDLDWSGGGMSDPGTTILESGASGTIDPASTAVGLSHRTLINYGSLTWSSGSIQADYATIDNRGTFRANSESTTGSNGYGLYSYNGPSKFLNTGTVLKSAGSGKTWVRIAFNNASSVDAQTGRLAFNGGSVAGTPVSGSWSADPAAVVEWGGGAFALGSDINLSGHISVTTAVAAQSVQAPDATLSIDGIGSLSLTDAATASHVSDLDLTGGSVAGDGTLFISHALTWSAGGMTGNGTTVLANGASGTITPPDGSWVALNGRTLRNDGTLTWSSGSLRADGATIDNHGTFNVNSEDPGSSYGSGIYTYLVPGRFMNTGTVVKSSGTGSTRIVVPFDNAGSVSTQHGELMFEGGSVSGNQASGSWSASAAATTMWGYGTFSLGSDVALAGDIEVGGTVTVNAKSLRASDATLTLDNQSTMSLTDLTDASQVRDLVIAGGTLGGAGRLRVARSMSWTGGYMSGSGVTQIAPQAIATIDPGAQGSVGLGQRVLSNQGTLTWRSGEFDGSDAAVLDNSGTFYANSESVGMWVWSGTTPVLNNVGTVRKTAGTGTTWIRWALGNAGTLVADTGTIKAIGPEAYAATATTDQAGASNAAELNAQRSCAGKPVDCATGNQFEIQTDLAVGARGLGLQATRTYNSQAAATATAPGAFGYGWTGSYSDHLVLSSIYRTATVSQSDGSTVVFSDYGGGDYEAAPWVQATLAKNADGTYLYTLPSQQTLTFAADGTLLEEADRNNNATTMTYSAGRLTTVTDPAGRSLSYAYNTDGTVASITDPAGLMVNYTYAGGELTDVRYGGIAARRWGFAYDDAHQLTGMTDARDNTTITRYDTSNRVIEQTDALHRTRTWSYGTDDTTITNPGGDVTHEAFENGQPVRITRAEGTPDEATQTLTYNAIRALDSITDPSGHITSYGYDSTGNRTSVTIPGGRTSSVTYDAERDVTSATSPSGKVTTFVHDANGDLTSVTRTLTVAGHDDVAQTSTFGYDAAGDQTSATDPLGRTTTATYDARGDMITQTDALGHTTSWTYDADSRPSSVTTPRGNESGVNAARFTTTITRDALGRPVETTDGLGRHATSTYDEIGNVVEQTDAEHRSTTFVYDAENQLTSVTRPGDATSHTMYDANGQVRTQTDADGHVTTYARDALSRVTEVDDPLSRATRLSYDASGRVTSQTDPSGRTTRYQYTPAGDLDSIDYQDPTTHDISYTYDDDGQRIASTDATGRTTFGYDSLGRLTSVTDGDGQTVGYGYDLADEQTSVDYPGAGARVTRSYDPAGRVSSISDWLGNTTSYAYDADDDTTTLTYPSSTHDVEHYDYDDADRATAQTITHDATPRAAYAYAYNATDQLLTQTDTGELAATHSYGYDTQGRLASDASATFEQDPAGDLTQLRGAQHSYDDADELTSATQADQSTSYAYDPDGDRIQTTPPTGPSIDYGYDQADQLTSIDEHTGPPVTYEYAADGLRASKTKGSQTTRFTWDRSTATPVLLAQDATRYVYDADGLPLEQIDATGHVRFLHHDRLGSTRLVTDAAGTTQATYSYDAYGQQTTTSGSSDVPFGYAGQYTDADTGLIYLRARYYDPSTGQFLTRDPLQAISGSAYGYAGDDPANLVDPSGLLLGIPGTPSASDLINSVAGFGDAASLGVSKWARQQLGDDNVDYCSASYSGGSGTGQAFALLIPGEGEEVAAVGAIEDAAKAAPEIKAGASGGATAGKAFPQSVRKEALEENPSTCVFCRMETETPQVDHSIPRARGGDATIENAQTACPHCNASKGARDYPVNPPAGYRGPWPPPWWP